MLCSLNLAIRKLMNKCNKRKHVLYRAGILYVYNVIYVNPKCWIYIHIGILNNCIINTSGKP